MLAEKKLGIKAGIIVCAMRQNSPQQSVELANLAVKHAKKGVVGFDIAGPEKGHPAKLFEEAYHIARKVRE